MKSKPWYLRKIFLIPVGLIVGSVALASTNNTPTTQPIVSPVTQEILVPAQTVNNTTVEKTQASEKQSIKTTSEPKASSGLSNDNYYTNVDGNQVHSPAYSDSVPAGASARCRDGTYSFSQNRRGTCSRHGGVASWL